MTLLWPRAQAYIMVRCVVATSSRVPLYHNESLYGNNKTVWGHDFTVRLCFLLQIRLINCGLCCKFV